MKRVGIFVISILVSFLMCACSNQKAENIVNMTLSEGEEYSSIIWNDKTYIPYCVISKNRQGKQIGIVNGDKDDRVYEFKEHSTDEWIINSLTMDGGAILYKETKVTEIPSELKSDYEWNN